ncbi:MAG: universal stress protein [Acidobacteria bacterium]|nr:universal stress protein [Acidobacteriota bacterium]
MPAPIVVPTDFSPPSLAALAFARALAPALGAPLHLLHLVATSSRRPPRGDVRPIAAAARRRLQDALGGEGCTPHALPVVAHGDETAEAITEYARSSGAGLIVMRTHGRSGVAPLLMGSVAEKVVRTAGCPVLTIHRTAPAPAVRFRRILVATDFSAPSDAALDCARALAAPLGAPLHLLHVLEDTRVGDGMGPDVFVAESPEGRSARLREARVQLAHRVTDDDRARLRTTAEVIYGASARSIADYAADNEFDLIVMGTHGRTGLAHLLVGSVTEQVIRTAACPVLATRHAWPGGGVAHPAHAAAGAAA